MGRKDLGREMRMEKIVPIARLCGVCCKLVGLVWWDMGPSPRWRALRRQLQGSCDRGKFISALAGVVLVLGLLVKEGKDKER